jgi:hypothetical protein
MDGGGRGKVGEGFYIVIHEETHPNASHIHRPQSGTQMSRNQKKAMSLYAHYPVDRIIIMQQA